MKTKLATTLAAFLLAAQMVIGSGVGVVTLSDNYTTRGIVCNDELNEQTFIDASLGTNGAGIMVIQIMDLTDNFDNHNNVTEFDLVPYYMKTLKNGVDFVKFGVAQYTFPNTEYEDTYELMVRYQTPLMYSVLFYDVDLVDSWYLQAGLTPTINVNDSVALQTTGSIGYGGDKYNEFYSARDQYALNDIVIKEDVIYTYKSVQLIGTLGYSFNPDQDMEDGANEVYGKSNTRILSVSVVGIF